MNPGRKKRDLSQFSEAISSAFTEWLLILLLLIDSFCLYLMTKIIRFSNLQTPCLVCSRFTHLLGIEKLELYSELLCDFHKLKISTFAFCHAHKRLGEAAKMCETCLFSLHQKQSTLDADKIWLRKIGANLAGNDQIFKTSSDEMVEVPLLKNDHEVYSPHKKTSCSCCSQLCNIKPTTYRLFEYKQVFKDLVRPSTQFLGSVMQPRFVFPHKLSKTGEIPTIQLTNHHLEDDAFDHLSNLGYSVLKFSSESESEIPYLTDDNDDGSKPFGAEDLKEESVSQNLKPSTHISGSQKDLTEVSDNMALEKLIHLNPVPNDSSIYKNQLHEGDSGINILGHGLEEINWINVDEKPNLQLSSQIKLKSVPAEISKVEVLAEIDVSRTLSTSKVKLTKSLDLYSKPNKVLNNSEGNLSSCANGFLPSSEISLPTESATILEDLKQQLFQNPSGSFQEYSFNDSQIFAKILNANLPCLEFADGSIVPAVEEERITDSLRRQIDMDRKFLNNLYKELEEERNASAIAANQAMAMINKLQEEKAAMQLEAMQYLRMMEEQNEYEQEALQKLNDQLAERGKEIQDLEAELAICRKRCWDESFAVKIMHPSYDSDESEYSTTSTPHVLKPRKRDEQHSTDYAWSAFGSIKETGLDFDDEREYISECLKRLEKNVTLFSAADASVHVEEDDEMYADSAKRKRFQKQCLNEEKRPAESISCEGWDSAIKDVEKDSKLKSFISDKIQANGGMRRNDVMAIGNEIEHLHARLEALETDRDFVERAVNSLKNGKDGLQFVQEIATHLRELRKIEFKQRREVGFESFMQYFQKQ